jgi:opacity protein-like surface antigen
MFNYFKVRREGFMKKLLLTTAAALAISSSAFADMDQFYLRGDVAMSKFDKLKAAGYSHKTKFNSFGLDVGVGTNVMDNMRAELVYNHVFASKAKNTEGGVTSNVKPQAQALMLRGLVDVADLGMAKAFVGAGLGWAKTSAKATGGLSGKAKAKNNLAWSAHVGLGFDVADGVKADVAYSFRDYGKTKAFGGVAAAGKASVRSHNLSAGVRFDI